MRGIKRVIPLILCMLMSGCTVLNTGEQGYEGEQVNKVINDSSVTIDVKGATNGYWAVQGVTTELGQDIDIPILDIRGNGLDEGHIYQNIGERDKSDIGIAFNQQLDVYLQKVIEVLASEATEDMTNIVLSNVTGEYDGHLWYFLVESYDNTQTGNRVIDIMGLMDTGGRNLVVYDLGIEDKAENIPQEIIEGFITSYKLPYKYKDFVEN